MMGPRVMPLNIFEAVKWKTLDVFFHISLAQTGVDTTTAMFTRKDVDIHTVWSRWNTDAVYHRLLSMSWMSCCIWPWFIVMVKASYSPNFMHLIISLLTCNWLSSPGTWIVYRLSISQERPTPPIWPLRSHNKVNYQEEVGKGTDATLPHSVSAANVQSIIAAKTALDEAGWVSIQELWCCLL